MTPIPEIHEDALAEQAFNELQGEERVVATWSRARDSCSCDQSNLLIFRILSVIRWVKHRILLDNKKADEN